MRPVAGQRARRREDGGSKGKGNDGTARTGNKLLEFAHYREPLMVSLVYPELAEGNHPLTLSLSKGERTDHDAYFYNSVLVADPSIVRTPSRSHLHCRRLSRFRSKLRRVVLYTLHL